jgi:hypothetical protein
MITPSEEPKKQKQKNKRESKYKIDLKKKKKKKTQGASKFHTSLQICCCHKFKQNSSRVKAK